MDHDQREPDVSKIQQAQQPQPAIQRQPEMDQQGQSAEPSGSFETQQPPTGQADYGSADEAETLERSDVEGSAATADASESAFLGTQGSGDTSSELIEEEGSDFARDGQGASE